MSKTDKPSLLLVPKPEGERSEAGKKGYGLYLLEERMRTVAPFQVIVRNSGAQVMNMMKPNVPGKPLQDLRQLIKRTPLEGGVGVVPLVRAFPVHSLELVLN